MDTTKSEKGNEGAEGRREDSQFLMHMWSEPHHYNRASINTKKLNIYLFNYDTSFVQKIIYDVSKS
jgi:hypothetical protein